MRKESAGVTEALIESAKKEFLEYGFQNANLRRISADSGVSTNSIYTRFGDKSGLFSAVVKPAADGLMKMYLDSIGEAEKCGNAAVAAAMGDEGTEAVLKYIYDNFDEFRLIFCRSADTEYEHFIDKLAEIEESSYKKFVEQFAENGRKVSGFFIHVVCRAGWHYIYEVVSHGLSYDEARSVMKNVLEFSFAGWAKVLGANFEIIEQ